MSLKSALDQLFPLTPLKPGSASAIERLLVSSLLLSPCFQPVAYHTTYCARLENPARGYAVVLLKNSSDATHKVKRMRYAQRLPESKGRTACLLQALSSDYRILYLPGAQETLQLQDRSAVSLSSPPLPLSPYVSPFFQTKGVVFYEGLF